MGRRHYHAHEQPSGKDPPRDRTSHQDGLPQPLRQRAGGAHPQRDYLSDQLQAPRPADESIHRPHSRHHRIHDQTSGAQPRLEFSRRHDSRRNQQPRSMPNHLPEPESPRGTSALPPRTRRPPGAHDARAARQFPLRSHPLGILQHQEPLHRGHEPQSAQRSPPRRHRRDTQPRIPRRERQPYRGGPPGLPGKGELPELGQPGPE
mmetsp:Transcript_32664/g.97545  ORF Transcript_32664/g.97545 Transcript_32664/m.97545 type:complete len:205 (-) Transcript_32664:526-1140(-)